MGKRTIKNKRSKAPKDNGNHKEEAELREVKVTSKEEAGAENKKAASPDEPEKKSRKKTGEDDIQIADSQSDKIKELQDKIKALEAEMAKNSDQLLRAQADYTNLRKRMDREVAESIRFSKENLIKLILPIVDDFGRSLQAMEKTDNLTAIKEGINMINNNIGRVFNKIGVEAIESVGKEFDPNLHEAITSIPVDDEKQKGIVIDEIEKGYKLNQRIVRFAKVVIGE